MTQLIMFPLLLWLAWHFGGWPWLAIAFGALVLVELQGMRDSESELSDLLDSVRGTLLRLKESNDDLKTSLRHLEDDRVISKDA